MSFSRNNQKGLTAIELLVSLFIMSIILASSTAFYEYYTHRSSEFGGINTARMLAVNALETQIELIKNGDVRTGEVLHETVLVNGTSYELIVTKTDAVSTAAYYNQHIPFYLINSKVNYKNMTAEVNSYASAE